MGTSMRRRRPVGHQSTERGIWSFIHTRQKDYMKPGTTCRDVRATAEVSRRRRRRLSIASPSTAGNNQRWHDGINPTSWIILSVVNFINHNRWNRYGIDRVCRLNRTQHLIGLPRLHPSSSLIPSYNHNLQTPSSSLTTPTHWPTSLVRSCTTRLSSRSGNNTRKEGQSSSA
jgi:hypothetical protein